MNENLIRKITFNSIVYVAFMSIPLNVITFFAIEKSEYQIVRIFPPLLGLFVILLAIIRKSINITYTTFLFVSILFLAGSFNLLLGLIDLASLWFLLAIIFTLLTSQRKNALFIFILSFIFILVTGILMMLKNQFIPLDYGFENCQFACVSIRILHFLLIGFLVYYILNIFISTINNNFNIIEEKANQLEILNIALKNEEKEKELIRKKMIEAVILTEEKERKRIASDLHDGLGPVLSAINLYYQAYIDADTNAKVKIEIKLKKIIADAIEDISRISHNISPYILENYGLVIALENFVSHINTSKKIKFNLDIEKEKKIKHINEIAIYRVLTELINNTIKHADAKQIDISINTSFEKMIIFYADNGKGFNFEEQVENFTGSGLKNIQNRIKSLSGKFKINSKENLGMTVEIEIPIKE